MKNQKVIIITGNKGSGKTTLANEYIEYLKEKNIKIGGIITKSNATKRFEKKLYYSVVDILTNEEKKLLTINKISPKSIGIGRFSMDQEALDWAIEKIVSASKICTAIIIDELGPAELQGLGYSGIAKELVNSYKGLIILSVRIEILEQMRSYLHCDPETTIIVDVENNDKSKYKVLHKVQMDE